MLRTTVIQCNIQLIHVHLCHCTHQIFHLLNKEKSTKLNHQKPRFCHSSYNSKFYTLCVTPRVENSPFVCVGDNEIPLDNEVVFDFLDNLVVVEEYKGAAAYTSVV